MEYPIINFITSLFLLVFILGTLLPVPSFATKCGLDHSLVQEILEVRGECFFTITDATADASLRLNDTHYKFDVDSARRVCRRMNATLPIFKGEEDSQPASESFRNLFNINSKWSISRVALDILQDMNNGNIEHKWIDGSKVMFTGTWLNKDTVAACTVARVDGSGAWENLRGDFVDASPVGVVCKKHSRPKRRSVNTNSAPANASPCNQRPPPTDLIHPMLDKRGQMCYFAKSTAADEANVRKGEKYVFNITKGREICKQYNATLVSVNSNHENTWLIREIEGILLLDGPPVFYVALGLTQRSDGNSYSYVWDNGQNATYEFRWPNKFSSAAYTVFKIWELRERWSRYSYDTWENVPDHSYEWNQTVYVVCQKPHAAADSTTTTPEPAPTNISKCDHGSSKAFPRVAVYAGKACYFTVSGSLEKTYPRMDAYFHIWTAREICNNESASLPVIESEAEYNFIMSTFSSKDLTELDNKRARYVALDLRQTTNVDKYQYSDGRPPAYQPDVWKNKTSYAYYITMSLDNISFINHEGMDKYRVVALEDNLIGVVCKQSHYSASPSSEPQTETVAPTSPSPTAAVASSVPTSSIETSSKDKADTSSVSTRKRASTPEMKTGIPTGNKCGQEGSRYYKKTAQYDMLCYFVIKDATIDAILSAEDGGFRLFNLNNARESCGKHGATLPILYSKSEANFILDHFSASDFPTANRMLIPAGIALDMDVNKAGRYAWRNGMAVSYKPAKWTKLRRMESAQTLRVFMHFRTGAGDRFVRWETHDGAERVILAVLCQQEIEPRVYDPDQNGKRQTRMSAETIFFMLIGGFLI